MVKELIKRPIQYIHISQKNYFQETRRGEGTGIPRLQVIHEITKGKVALIGVGGLRTQNDFTKANNTGYSEFIAAGISNMRNKDLGTLLKENKADKLELELDPEHPERYEMGENMWNFCLSDEAPGHFPPVKGKTRKKPNLLV